MVCHRCRTEMTVREEEGIEGFFCAQCQSHAITMGKLRKGGIAMNRLKPFWLQSKGLPAKGPCCPRCSKKMVVVQSKENLELDVCRGCSLLFFDQQELHSLIYGAEVSKEHGSPHDTSTKTHDLPEDIESYSPDVQMMFMKKRGDDELPDHLSLDPDLISFRRFFAVLRIPVKRDESRRTSEALQLES